jgi:hypothetical protein
MCAGSDLRPGPTHAPRFVSYTGGPRHLARVQVDFTICCQHRLGVCLVRFFVTFSNPYTRDTDVGLL